MANKNHLAVEYFDLAEWNEHAKGFVGAVAAKDHIYFVPYANSLAIRFDASTGCGFHSVDHWEPANLANVDPRARGYHQAVFDGRFIYFVPYHNSDGFHGIFVRYDTRLPFDPKKPTEAWTVQDVTTFAARGFENARGFVDAVVAGNFIYFVPLLIADNVHSGQFLRYDRRLEFHNAEAWTLFDVSAPDTGVHPGAKGYHGAAFDGRYLYFAPHWNGDSPHGLALRYDSCMPFNRKGSWCKFDMPNQNTGIDNAAAGYVGCAFDGRFVYFAPFFTDVFVRYDTKSRYGFGNKRSWSRFLGRSLWQGTSPNPRFYDAVALRNRIFFVPFDDGAQPHGSLVWYDKRRRFDKEAAWSIYDMTVQYPLLKGFAGGAKHGQHVYLAPMYSSVVCEREIYSGLVARISVR